MADAYLRVWERTGQDRRDLRTRSIRGNADIEEQDPIIYKVSQYPYGKEKNNKQMIHQWNIDYLSFQNIETVEKKRKNPEVSIWIQARDE